MMHLFQQTYRAGAGFISVNQWNMTHTQVLLLCCSRKYLIITNLCEVQVFVLGALQESITFAKHIIYLM
jgi:hypothetical protein